MTPGLKRDPVRMFSHDFGESIQDRLFRVLLAEFDEIARGMKALRPDQVLIQRKGFMSSHRP
jgi:hypothetical protein